MRDIGHEETEKVLLGIEKRITAEYSRAEKEIQKKLDTYMKLFAVKDRLKLMAVDKGLISEGEYKQWRLGQVMVGKRWEEMRNTIAQDLSAASQIARSIAFDHIPDVYAINHDYGTFQVEKGALVDTSYTLYDRNAMEQLYKNEDTFIPAPGRKISRAINEGRQVAWDKKQVQSAMMQSLLQGESIPNIATRLSKTVGESDRKAAIRNARTLTTGVENAGRTASYDRANALGIKTKKQWLAALDMRTRHWHAELDGVSVDNDKPFHNEYGDIMYPGDPTADPANISNCRCTLTADIEGFENDLSDMSLRRDEKLGDMSYDEWKAGHYDVESDRITKQDEIAETMKRVYGAEYGGYREINNLPNDENHGSMSLKDMFEKAENVGTDGKRNEKPLSEREITELTNYARTLGFTGDIQYSDYSNTGFVYSEYFGDRYCRLVIGTDAKPVELVAKGMKANQLLSSKAAIAHEIVGHYEAWQNGFNLSEKPLEEAQASIRAARFAEGLSKSDRYMLIRDGLDRLKNAGIPLSEARKKMRIERR